MWVAHVQCWNCRSKLCCFDINFKKSVNDEHEQLYGQFLVLASLLVTGTQTRGILGTVYLHLARKQILIYWQY